MSIDSTIFRAQFGVDPTKLDLVKELERLGFVRIANMVVTKRITLNEDHVFQYNLLYNDIYFGEIRPPKDPVVT